MNLKHLGFKSVHKMGNLLVSSSIIMLYYFEAVLIFAVLINMIFFSLHSIPLYYRYLDDVKSLSLPGTYNEKISSLGTSLSGFTRLKSLDLSRNALVTTEVILFSTFKMQCTRKFPIHKSITANCNVYYLSSFWEKSRNNLFISLSNNITKNNFVFSSQW